MIPDEAVCERARRAKDPRFDGRFFTAVLSTGIYCRPVCPARAPARDNVRYFPSAAAAQEAGYRPCLRCRPEQARPAPEWTYGSPVVRAGLRLIEAGYLNTETTAGLAARLGVSSRHLDRLFLAEVGATPGSLARQKRIQLAKRLIDDTQLTFTEVALNAGFGSVRRFNAEMKAAYRRPPSELRQERITAADASIRMHLPVRLPYDEHWVFSFHKKRALEPLETVTMTPVPTYQRDLGDNQELTVRWHGGGPVADFDNKRTVLPPGLIVQFSRPVGDRLTDYLARVSRLFDVAADSEIIDIQLGEDAVIGSWVRRHPGLRVPGAWDGFEQAVRAILGQQVSVARATDLAARLIEIYGDGAFPAPATLAAVNPAEIGMPGARGRAISGLAAAVDAGDIAFDADVDSTRLTQMLCAIKGIGPWTAGYIAMRVARDPDGLPDNDWVLLKQLGATAAGVRRLAENWRPWRAYGVMATWCAAGNGLSRAVQDAPAE